MATIRAMEGGSRRAIVAALLANLGITLAKFLAFAVTGAASLLAEAVHSVADTSNQSLLLLGGFRARRAATSQHPFGYGRERYFWSFVVAMTVFSLGSAFALFEGVLKLRHPHELESPQWAFGVIGLAMVLESLSLRTAIRESRDHVRGAGSWWKFIRRSKIPELPVVLLEDTGAITGLSFALLGVGLAEATGNPRFDALGSIAIGLLLAAIAVILVTEMKSLLIGESASPAQQEAIRRAVEGDGDVCRLIHMRTQHLGPDELLVGAKIEVAATLDAPGVADAINGVEARIREAVPEARVLYIEPDITRSAEEQAQTKTQAKA